MKNFNLRKLLILIFLSLILSVSQTFALQVNKVVYDADGADTGQEWFEVCNETENDIPDFSENYKVITPPLSDSSKPYAEHKISETTRDDLASGQCAALTQDSGIFEKNNSGYLGLVFDSSWSDLKNTEGFVGLLNGEQIVACQSYGTGACPESLEESSTTETEASSTEKASSTSEANENDIYVPENNQAQIGNIELLLPQKKTVIALADATYTAKAVNDQEKLIPQVNFSWSFGDGAFRTGDVVNYHYTYPGNYILVAEADDPVSSAKATTRVNVVAPKIKIIKVGNGDKENYVELENDTDSDLFLSDFYLEIAGHDYQLPKNLLLAKHSTTKISGVALGFSLPASTTKLLYPDKNLLTQFPWVTSTATSTGNSASTEKKKISLKAQALVEANEVELATDSEEKIIDSINLKKISTPTENLALENSTKKSTPVKIIKRLVLGGNRRSADTNYESFESHSDLQPTTSLNSDNVDIGLIQWFKNLLY